MKNIISASLVLLLAIVGIAGCFGNGEVLEDYVYEYEEVEEYAAPPLDYSQFVGDWHIYRAAMDVILQISAVENNEITFNLIYFYHSDGNEFSMLGDYTLPIIDGQVRFEENDIRGEDDWTKRNHTLTFFEDYIAWQIDSSWSFTRYDGTIRTGGEASDEFYWRLVSTLARPIPEWLQKKIDEVRN